MAGRHRIIETPVGDFAIVVDDRGRIGTAWVDVDGPFPAGSRPDASLEPELSARLASYFAGTPVTFDGPLPAGRPFFRRCWAACRAIPRGTTRSYGELAIEAGSSTAAARAAGQAMRRNPQPVLVPCHRVVAADGRLHGYAGSRDTGGGPLAVKRFLLRLEGAAPGRTPGEPASLFELV